MTDFLQWLLERLRELWGYIVPWAILPDDECGLVRRFGVTKRVLSHGWNWKWPFVEIALTAVSAFDSYALREQSLTTRDGQQVTLRGVITYNVVDPYKWIVAIHETDSVLNDAGCIAIGELVAELTADEVLRGKDFLGVLTRRVRARAKRWGIEVDAGGLVDRTAAPTVRLMGVK